MTTSPPEEATNPPEEPTDSITLYVNNLPLNCDQNEIQAFFEKYGSVINVTNRKNKKDSSFSGNSFVTFAHREDGERAIQELNNSKFKDNIIQVEKSKRPFEKDYKGKPNNNRRYRDDPDRYSRSSMSHRYAERYPPRMDRGYDMPMYSHRDPYYGQYYDDPYRDSRRAYRDPYPEYDSRPRYSRRSEYDDELRRPPPRYSHQRGNDSDD